MTLDPKDDIVMQVIKTYEGYATTLSGEKRECFDEMLALCYQIAEAINAKGEPFTEEAIIMAQYRQNSTHLIQYYKKKPQNSRENDVTLSGWIFGAYALKDKNGNLGQDRARPSHKSCR